MTPPVPQVRGSREAMTVQDWAAQRCTISYRAPELFNVESHCVIDARTDIWVGLEELITVIVDRLLIISYWSCQTLSSEHNGSF